MLFPLPFGTIVFVIVIVLYLMEKHLVQTRRALYRGCTSGLVRTRLSGLVRSVVRRRSHVQGFAKSLNGLRT